ncbi:hypothetical protein [Hankyongella ginsenosidimutans]|uniref:hypothetical protein n=1 Tax=Hankyongella ginsenosidimutans TaxID=1763828 RepID=UPI001CA3649E|nr:hypothetical protein [Hankyongella ginsenosidimutans]
MQYAAPRLALSGRANSTLKVALEHNQLKSADIELAIRGLRRSGLSSASIPVDVRVSGALDSEKARLALDANVGDAQVGLVRLRIPPVAGPQRH